MKLTDLFGEPSVETLLEVLRNERSILERLDLQLGEAGFLVRAHLDRFLVHAADDIGYLETELSELEILRAIVVAGVASSWGIPGRDLSLTEIIDRVEPKYRDLFVRELELMRHLTREIARAKDSISSLAADRLAATRTAISELADVPAEASERARGAE